MKKFQGITHVGDAVATRVTLADKVNLKNLRKSLMTSIKILTTFCATLDFSAILVHKLFIDIGWRTTMLDGSISAITGITSNLMKVTFGITTPSMYFVIMMFCTLFLLISIVKSTYNTSDSIKENLKLFAGCAVSYFVFSLSRYLFVMFL